MTRFNKVLLIHADYPDSHYHYFELPTGLGYLAETLINNGINNDLFDLSANHSFKKLKMKIKSYQPDLIGYSLMTFRYKYNYQIMERIKRIFPGIPIVAGGPHISTLREKVLKDCPAIDFGVTLEGEKTLLELCQGEDIINIKGLIYRDQKENICYLSDQEFIDPLDLVPFPRYEKFDLKKYPKVITIASSRGCPYACIYCPVKRAIGRSLRVRNASNVVDEFEYWYRRGYRDFSFADDNFTFYQERVYQICDEITERKLVGLRIRCGNGIRADKVTKDLLKKMKEVGFYHLAFGVEAGNDRILKNIKKGTHLKVIKQAIKNACDLDFEVTLFFLIGSPGETWGDFLDSIKLAREYPVMRVSFYNLIPFPHTELYDWAKKNNYFTIPPERYLNDASGWVNQPLFATPEFSLEQRKKAYNYDQEFIKKEIFPRVKERNIWLTKQKLKDYYRISGPLADIISWIYNIDLLQHKLGKLIKKFI